MLDVCVEEYTIGVPNGRASRLRAGKHTPSSPGPAEPGSVVDRYLQTHTRPVGLIVRREVCT